MNEWQEADDAFNRSMDEPATEWIDPPSDRAYSDYVSLPLKAHEIRELSTNRKHIEGRIPLYYAEGDSGPLWAGRFFNEAVPDYDPPGYSWFCFEGFWVEVAMELQRLGFTAGQILEARDHG